MQTATIIEEITKLPIADRILILENTLKSIKEETVKNKKSLSEAAMTLLSDYQTDEELLAFTGLDSENFYEAKWNLVDQPGPDDRFWNS